MFRRKFEDIAGKHRRGRHSHGGIDTFDSVYSDLMEEAALAAVCSMCRVIFLTSALLTSM